MKLSGNYQLPWNSQLTPHLCRYAKWLWRVKWRCQRSEDPPPCKGAEHPGALPSHRNHHLSLRWALSPAGAAPKAPRAWWPMLPATPPFSTALRSWAPGSKLLPPNLLSDCSGRFERVTLRCTASVTREQPSGPNDFLLHARANSGETYFSSQKREVEHLEELEERPEAGGCGGQGAWLLGLVLGWGLMEHQPGSGRGQRGLQSDSHWRVALPETKVISMDFIYLFFWWP